MDQQKFTPNSLFDQVNALLSSWNPLEVPDYVADVIWASDSQTKDYLAEWK